MFNQSQYTTKVENTIVDTRAIALLTGENRMTEIVNEQYVIEALPGGIATILDRKDFMRALRDHLPYNLNFVDRRDWQHFWLSRLPKPTDRELFAWAWSDSRNRYFDDRKPVTGNKLDERRWNFLSWRVRRNWLRMAEKCLFMRDNDDPLAQPFGIRRGTPVWDATIYSDDLYSVQTYTVQGGSLWHKVYNNSEGVAFRYLRSFGLYVWNRRKYQTEEDYNHVVSARNKVRDSLNSGKSVEKIVGSEVQLSILNGLVRFSKVVRMGTKGSRKALIRKGFVQWVNELEDGVELTAAGKLLMAGAIKAAAQRKEERKVAQEKREALQNAALKIIRVKAESAIGAANLHDVRGYDFLGSTYDLTIELDERGRNGVRVELTPVEDKFKVTKVEFKHGGGTHEGIGEIKDFAKIVNNAKLIALALTGVQLRFEL